MLLDSFARLLDSKLAPIDNLLTSLDSQLTKIESIPIDKVKRSVPPNPELMNFLENRSDKFFAETFDQTQRTISEGIQYYNVGLAEREAAYAREH